MNIIESENKFIMEAKICGCSNNEKTVSYHYIESVYNLCLENREIIFAQIQACERLLKYTKEEEEILAIKRDIVDLHLALASVKTFIFKAKTITCLEGHLIPL